jgi:uncharacterized membrane protein YgcG
LGIKVVVAVIAATAGGVWTCYAVAFITTMYQLCDMWSQQQQQQQQQRCIEMGLEVIVAVLAAAVGDWTCCAISFITKNVPTLYQMAPATAAAAVAPAGYSSSTSISSGEASGIKCEISSSVSIVKGGGGGGGGSSCAWPVISQLALEQEAGVVQGALLGPTVKHPRFTHIWVGGLESSVWKLEF